MLTINLRVSESVGISIAILDIPLSSKRYSFTSLRLSDQSKEYSTLTLLVLSLTGVPSRLATFTKALKGRPGLKLLASLIISSVYLTLLIVTLVEPFCLRPDGEILKG